jgi:protein phosphatase
MPFRLHHAAATDVGLQRSHNEDAVLTEPELGVFVICDGMGGHASGAVASDVAVTTIADALRSQPAGDAEPLVAAILAANRAVFQRSLDDSDCFGMGTTVVGLRFDGERVHVCHIGDSRIYLLRRGELMPITRDHSLINLYADNPDLVGKLGPAHANVIVRAVGLHQEVEVEHKVITVEPDDIYLLCSDGLIDMADDWIVREMLTSGDELDALVASLIRVANANGGADNVSVIVIRVSRDGAP